MYYFRRLSDCDVPLSQPIPSHLSCVPKYQELPQKIRSLLLQESGRWPPLLELSPLLPYNLSAHYNLSWALCSVPFDPSFAYLCNLDF